MSPHSPRAMLKRQLARLDAMKMKAFCASELEFLPVRRQLRGRRRKGYRNLKTSGHYIEDYHILQTTKEEGVMRAIRHRAARRRHSRSRTPRANGGRARKRSTSAMPMRWRWPTATSIMKNAMQGDRACGQGKAVTFMAKWRLRFGGHLRHIHQSLWVEKDGKSAVLRRARPSTACRS